MLLAPAGGERSPPPALKLLHCFPTVPDDSWPLYCSRLNCSGSERSEEVPRWVVGGQQCLKLQTLKILGASTKKFHVSLKKQKATLCAVVITWTRASQGGFLVFSTTPREKLQETRKTDPVQSLNFGPYWEVTVNSHNSGRFSAHCPEWRDCSSWLKDSAVSVFMFV